MRRIRCAIRAESQRWIRLAEGWALSSSEGQSDGSGGGLLILFPKPIRPLAGGAHPLEGQIFGKGRGFSNMITPHPPRPAHMRRTPSRIDTGQQSAIIWHARE